MRSGGCWSSVVATVQERAALRLTPEHDWLVACVLPAGHGGAHASDGAQEHAGRRRWLLWGDYARGAQNLADEFECSAQALDGAPCLLFAGHGGQHRFAAPLGEDFPSTTPATPRPLPPQPPVADRGRHGAPSVDGRGRHGASDSSTPPPQPVPPPTQPVPTQPVPPPWMPAGTSAPAAPAPPPQQPNHFQAPPLPPEDESISTASLDALFAGMPSLKDLPHTELLAFPEGSFRTTAPSWPDSRGEYVAEHQLARPVQPETVVSGPNRFEPAGPASPEQIIDVEEVPDPGREELRAEPRERAESAAASGRHGRVEEPETDRTETDRTEIGRTEGQARDAEPQTRWMEVRPGAASVLTTPMVQVISSNDDPVRMGVPTARRRLSADDGDIESVTAAVADAAERLRALPDADGEVSAALQDVGQALARLSEVLRDR